MNNIVASSVKFITIDIIGDFLWWPVWWYSFGLFERLKWFWKQVVMTWDSLALGLWLKNFFVPMYADRSILGRAISLAMRFIILIWKLIWFFVWVFLSFALLVIWIAAPIGTVYMIYLQFR